MCRTVHALLQVVICGIQMLVRVFMTIILMIENLIRMILQTLYNFISFMMQMISLIPICVVFLLTARLKCFMCGGGGPCPVNRGGACDCLMSAMAIVILLLIFRATGVLDKIFYKLGYVKARPLAYTKFVPTPGDITECSRNDTDYETNTTVTKESTVIDDKLAETYRAEDAEAQEVIADNDKAVDAEAKDELAYTDKPIDAEANEEIADSNKPTVADAKEIIPETDKPEDAKAKDVIADSTNTADDEAKEGITDSEKPADAEVKEGTADSEKTEDGRRRIPTRSFTTEVEYSDYLINTKDPGTKNAYNSNWTTVLYYLV